MDLLFDSSRINKNHPSYHDVGVTKAFSCPYCTGIAAHNWSYGLLHKVDPDVEFSIFNVVIAASCHACNKESIWLKNVDGMNDPSENYEILLYPKTSIYQEPPNPDMPSKVRQIYDEAALILENSPRASAALSRLAIDILTNELNAKGSNLNDRIGNLVSKGLPIQIQQALDAVRVIGNNAVHPGNIDMTDNKDLAISLLRFINLIIDNQITQPKLINEAYSSLPKGALRAIDKRDTLQN